jgi:hypothetical protein
LLLERHRLKDLLFGLEDSLLRRLFRRAAASECVNQRVMDEASALFACELAHHPVLLLVDESHPLFGELDGLTGEVPLDVLQVSLCVFASVAHLEGGGLGWVLEGGVLEGRELSVLGLRNRSVEWRAFEIVAVVEHAASSIVDEQAIVG